MERFAGMALINEESFDRVRIPVTLQNVLSRLDAALLPVAGWGPRLPAGHLDPVRAVEALALIEPRLAIPIHWGTYAPWRAPRGDDTPAKAFAELAATIVPTVDVRVLRPGQSCQLD